jgi:transposase
VRVRRQASPEARVAFAEQQAQLSSERLIFRDEFGLHLGLTRLLARTPRGERVEMTEPFETGPNLSVISALVLGGVRAPFLIAGEINGEIFELYLRHFLIPELRPGDLVLVDRVSFHRGAGVAESIAQAGAWVELQPAYSPDFNPIEECISKLKLCLRSAKARTLRALRRALARALSQITREDIRGWFTHCGYSCPPN